VPDVPGIGDKCQLKANAPREAKLLPRFELTPEKVAWENGQNVVKPHPHEKVNPERQP
jgi:hypothetical protein